MPCLERIPLDLIPEKVIKQLHLNKNKDALSIVKELLEIAESLIQLKVFFQVSYISKKGELVLSYQVDQLDLIPRSFCSFYATCSICRIALSKLRSAIFLMSSSL